MHVPSVRSRVQEAKIIRIHCIIMLRNYWVYGISQWQKCHLLLINWSDEHNVMYPVWSSREENVRITGNHCKKMWKQYSNLCFRYFATATSSSQVRSSTSAPWSELTVAFPFSTHCFFKVCISLRHNAWHCSVTQPTQYSVKSPPRRSVGPSRKAADDEEQCPGRFVGVALAGRIVA